MGKQYKGFSKQQHIEASQTINAVCKQLIELCDKIIPAYGVSSAVGKEIGKLVLTPNIMNKLKSTLDDAYLGEHGGEVDGSPYYDGHGYS
ncbi:MAG: hypothetical protein NTW84_07830 [Methanothrix sp.]|nr:hypothetical protein [Methanothrix sp.]